MPTLAWGQQRMGAGQGERVGEQRHIRSSAPTLKRSTRLIFHIFLNEGGYLPRRGVVEGAMKGRRVGLE